MKTSLNRLSGRLFDCINTAFMLLLSIVILLPFWDLIVRSLSDPLGANTLTFMLLPKNLDFSAYTYIFKDNDIIRAFGVTILRTCSGTFLSLLLVLMAAYPLSSKQLPGRNLLQTIFLIPMFFSGGMIPTYILIRSIGLIDNFFVYVLPGAVGLYNVVLARNYMMSIDRALEESAFIDGAGYVRIFFSVILPVSTPIVATLALWIAVGHWNAWFDCMIYIRKNDLKTVQYLLYKMRSLSLIENQEMLEYMMNNPNVKVTDTSLRMATTVVTMIPILCVYPFVQKYFVKGIMVGSLKG